MEGDPWRDERMAFEKRRGQRKYPRPTGRIIRVVATDGKTAAIQNVGGRWMVGSKLGRVTKGSFARFGKSGGYKPLPDEFLSYVTYVEASSTRPT